MNIKKALVWLITLLGLGLSNICIGANTDLLDKSTNNTNLQGNGAVYNSDGLKTFLINTIGTDILIPLLTLVSLIIIFIGIYKMMYSEKDEEQDKGKNMVLRSIIGIVVMVSAVFIAKGLVGSSGNAGVLNGENIDGVNIAKDLYGVIFFPFIKLAMFIVMGALFLILLTHAIKFIITPSDDIKKHSRTIIIWNIIGLIIVMSAKQLVVAIYGDASKSTTSTKGDLGDIGKGILNDQNLSFINNGINRIMGFVALMILVVIIYESFMLLTNPNKDDNIKRIKKSIIFAFIGVLIIGGGYLLSTFLSLNPQ
ncbi:MAG: hypothetical protein V3575_07130 [Candidatus Absconditabacteria bacterium]